MKEPAFTLGVEEEYLLVDRQTGDIAVSPPEEMLAQCQAVLAATQQTLADVRLMAQMARGPDKELNGFSLLWRALWASVSGRGGAGSSGAKR